VAARSKASAAACLLGFWVRIPPGAWMSLSYECGVLSGRSFCVGLITCPEESYRSWCACHLEASTIRKSRPTRAVAPWGGDRKCSNSIEPSFIPYCLVLIVLFPNSTPVPVMYFIPIWLRVETKPIPGHSYKATHFFWSFACSLI
jgi:hypothetical protein